MRHDMDFGKRIRRPVAKPLSVAEIEEWTIPVPEAGCWIWVRGTDKCGYGKTYVNGRHVGAHRASYEAHNGPVPAGLEVLHSCDTPSCCNPSHLRVGTHKENSLDRVKRGRSARLVGGLNPGAVLDIERVRMVREHQGSHSSAARAFGISIATAHRIRTNTSWSDIK